MHYKLSESVQYSILKEGVALFNRFKGDTHFIRPPFDLVIQALEAGPVTSEQLCSGSLLVAALPQFSAEQLQLVIEQCLELGIIEAFSPS